MTDLQNPAIIFAMACVFALVMYYIILLGYLVIRECCSAIKHWIVRVFSALEKESES